MQAYLFTDSRERMYPIWVDRDNARGHLMVEVPDDFGISLIVPEDVTPEELLAALEGLVSLIRAALRGWGAERN